jgi:hypothetical protein
VRQEAAAKLEGLLRQIRRVRPILAVLNPILDLRRLKPAGGLGVYPVKIIVSKRETQPPIYRIAKLSKGR